MCIYCHIFRFPLIILSNWYPSSGFKSKDVKIWLFSKILPNPLRQRLTSPLLAGKGLNMLIGLNICIFLLHLAPCLDVNNLSFAYYLLIKGVGHYLSYKLKLDMLKITFFNKQYLLYLSQNHI